MTITINNVEYPLQWGMGALEIYCDTMDCDLDGLSLIEDKLHPLLMQKAIVALVYGGVRNSCEINDLECKVTIPKLRHALNELPQEQFKAIMDDFINSKYLGKTLREHLFGNVDPEKKSNENSESEK